MTQNSQPTPIATPWDMATVYAASFLFSDLGGLFAPGALMAARLRALAEQNAQSPSSQG